MVFYYGVAGGTDAGVYENWPAAEKASRGKKGARVKKFTSQEDALAFVQAGGKSEVLVDNNGKWHRNEEGYLYRPEGIRTRTGSTYSTATIGFVEGAVICGLCHREGDTTQAVGMSLFLMHSIKPYASTNHRICEGCQSMLDFLLANVAQPLNDAATQRLVATLADLHNHLARLRGPDIPHSPGSPEEKGHGDNDGGIITPKVVPAGELSEDGCPASPGSRYCSQSRSRSRSRTTGKRSYCQGSRSPAARHVQSSESEESAADW